MKTLYDLLGALPSDDAEDLRTAFRKAVKGVHPDIHPDDPYAALKFREIVRANEILVDDEQRAVYDHLLDLARQEQALLSRHAVAARIHRFATGVIAVVAVSVVTAGGYLLFTHISAASVFLANPYDLAIHAKADIAAAKPAAMTGRSNESRSSAKHVASEASAEAVTPDAAVAAADAESIPAADAAVAPDPRLLRAQGVFAYRNGDLTGALAALDQAIDLDPEFSAAYIDRGIVFYRLQKFDRAYADISRAKRIEKAGRTKPAPTVAGKPRLHRPGAAASGSPLSRPRADGQAQPLEPFVSALQKG